MQREILWSTIQDHVLVAIPTDPGGDLLLDVVVPEEDLEDLVKIRDLELGEPNTHDLSHNDSEQKVESTAKAIPRAKTRKSSCHQRKSADEEKADESADEEKADESADEEKG